MTPDEIVRRAREAFRTDAAAPPLTLRGGNAVDGYDEAEPFDPARDEPTDTYLEAFAFWGLGYLDARSWRHYLPRLIDYALRHPDDPAMVVEALLRTLRPPDRYPPRLASLTAEQEATVISFLEALALGDDEGRLCDDAQQALEEWWLPGARHRPKPDEVVPRRVAGVELVAVERPSYRMSVPAGFTSSGVKDIPEESRVVEVWGGSLGGEVPTTIAVNVTPLAGRHLRQVLERAATGLRAARVDPRPVRVEGASRSERMDGLTRGASPAEPERITLVVAAADDEAVLLTVRSHPREDVEQAMERIVESFRIVRPTPSSSP